MIDQDKMRALAEGLRAAGPLACREAADAIDLLLAECALLRSRTNILSDLVGDLRSQRRAYASEFPMHEDGEPDEGRVHENIRKLKAELEAAAADKRDYLDTLVQVLNVIGYSEEFAAAHPDLKVSDGVKLFIAQRQGEGS